MPAPLGLEFPPVARTILRAAWRQRRYAALTAAALVSVSALTLAIWPRDYRAEATILVAPQNVPEQYVGSVATANVQERLAAISKQVLSAPRLEKLIETHHLYTRQRRFRTHEEILELMRRDIDITLERSWNQYSPGSFRIQYTGETPQLAADVTAQIGSFFIEENYRTREDNAAGTSEFLSESIARTRTDLDKLEARLADYKRTHPGQMPQQEAGLQMELAAAERSMQTAEDGIFQGRQALAETESLLLALEGFTKPLPAAPAPAQAAPPEPKDPETERLRAQLSALELQYRAQHPDVVRARQLLEAREKQLKDRPPAVAAARSPATTTTADWAAADLAGRLSMLRLRRRQLAESIDRAEKDRERYAGEASRLRAQIASLPVNEQELAALLRDYETLRTHYHSLLDKRFSAELAADLERRQKAERFVMLDPPRVPEKARGPSRWLLLAMLGVLSVTTAVAFSIARDARRQPLLGAWELPGSVPVLARLPGGAATQVPAIRWWELATPPAAAGLLAGALLLLRSGVL